ncbi:hypothetical protein [Salinispora mooreana]|uniref:hypothetical protein n=1 Tax=Salinispora mooreana TaxID=999545 RepID=UPI000364A67F|nr:hypothetical protein [Salinispora mooreana]
MTTPGSSADDCWRPPGAGAASASDPADAPNPPGTPHPAGAPAGTPNPTPGPVPRTPAGGYTGPPPTTPPPADWQPPLHLQPPPPRQLPEQDLTALDLAEQRAQHFTWTVGAVAAVILLVLSCAFCLRLVR